MKLKRAAAISLAGLVLSGCSGTGPLAPDAEEALAGVLVTAAEQTGEAQAGGYRHIVRRMLQGVRERGDATAQRMLRRARALRDSSGMARAEGDLEAARRYSVQSYHVLLGAIVQTFPNAPSRVGGMVDGMLQRMRERLGDREAPRIRKVLRYAANLRSRAEGTDRRVVPLGLNLTALNVLHRLVHHVRDGTDGAEDAAREAFGGMDG